MGSARERRRGRTGGSGRAMSLGAADPRNVRTPSAEGRPDRRYSAPLQVAKNGRLGLVIGPGLTVNGDRLEVEGYGDPVEWEAIEGKPEAFPATLESVAAMLVAGANISITVDDDARTITIAHVP